MSAFAPRSMAAITEARVREENVLKVLRGRGYRDVELVRVELLGEDMIEALFLRAAGDEGRRPAPRRPPRLHR